MSDKLVPASGHKVPYDAKWPGPPADIEERRIKADSCPCPFLRTMYIQGMLNPDENGVCPVQEVFDVMNWAGVGRMAFPLDRYFVHFPNGIPILSLLLTRPNATGILLKGITQEEKQERVETFLSFANENSKFSAVEFQNAIDFYLQKYEEVHGPGSAMKAEMIEGKDSKEQNFLLHGGPRGELATIMTVFGHSDTPFTPNYMTTDDVRALWDRHEFPKGWIQRRRPETSGFTCIDIRMGLRFYWMTYFSDSIFSAPLPESKVEKDPIKRMAHFSVNIELLRFCGYLGFWIIVLIGFILTELFAEYSNPSYPKDDPDTALLHQVFGYNNICIYFDYAPSNYVLPGVWAMVLGVWELYFLSFWLRMRAQAADGQLNQKLYIFLTCVLAIVALTFILFSTIFAVTPTGPNDTLIIHTAFFFVLQVGISFFALLNCVHGIYSGYYRELGLPRWFDYAVWTQFVVVALCSAFKIPVSSLAIANFNNGTAWKVSDEFDTLAYVIDRFWLMGAAVLPMLFVIFLLLTRYGKLERLEIHVSASTDKYRVVKLTQGASSIGANKAHLDINIEFTRMMGYLGFWLVVAIGFILTNVFSPSSDPPYPINDPDTSLLHQVFGYNNICIYFDYSPSNLVLPTVWAIILAIWLLYFLAYWLRMRAQVAEKKLKMRDYRILCVLLAYCVLAFMWFTTIFAVSPDGVNETLFIHTSFFFTMQVAISFLAMVNIYQGIASGYYKELGMPHWFDIGCYIYLALLIGCTAFKIPVATLAMANYDTATQTAWQTPGPWFDILANVIDKLWLLLAAFAPLLLIGYFVCFKRDKLERIHIQAAAGDEFYALDKQYANERFDNV